MIIERPLELGQPRRKVWCLSTEITNNNNGTYSFVNLPNEDLGFGSKVFVVDIPNLIFILTTKVGYFIRGQKLRLMYYLLQVIVFLVVLKLAKDYILIPMVYCLLVVQVL